MTKKKTIVGANIRRLRKEKGISPEKLAVELKCTVMQVFNYEGGRTRITEEIIIKACKILGTPVKKLFDEVKA